MTGNTKWFTVWSGPRIDGVFEKEVSAKKHAAWLDHTFAHTLWWYKKVRVTDPEGEEILFDDYEFKNGDSRKKTA